MTAVQIKNSLISHDFPVGLNSDFGGFSLDRERCKVGLNYYVYVNNNPVNFVDPTGLRQVFADDIDGDAIVANADDSLDVEVEVVRGDDEDETFNDELNVEVNGQVYTQHEVHSEKFLESDDLIDFTLPEGDDYEIELLDSTPSFDKPLRITSETAQGPIPLTPGVKESDAFLGHPNEITNPTMRESRESIGKSNGPWSEEKPQGKGCLIFKNAEEYSEMRDGLEATGLRTGDKIPLTIR